MLRDKLFSKLSDIITKKTKTVILLGLIVTLLMGFASSRVKMKMAFYEMLPKKLPEIESFLRIRDNFGFASAENVIIESKTGDRDRIIACAEELAPRIMQLQMAIKNKVDKSLDTIDMISRVEYKIDRAFFEKNSFLIQKESDLNSTLNLFSSLSIDGFLKNLNDNFEKEYIGEENKQSSLDGKQMLLFGLNSISNYIKSITGFIQNSDTLSIEKSVDGLVNGPSYYFSPDGKLLLMKVVMVDDIPDNYTLQYGKKIKELFKEMEQMYPDLWFGATGDSILSTDTFESIEKDFGLPNIISILLIIFLLVGAFGSWKDPFWAMVTLFLAIFWTVGFVGLTIRYLNLISMAFAILLIGLGIDFAIHLISGYKAAEKEGHSPQRAIKQMFDKRGIGIVTGGLTTTFAFLALSLTDFPALTEIAIACGMGIFFCMVSSLTVFPALMLFNNKGYSVTGRFLKKIRLGFIADIWSAFGKFIPRLIPGKVKLVIEQFFQFTYLEKIGNLLKSTPISITVLIVALCMTIYSLMKIKTIEFEYNFMKLEAEGVMSEVSQNKILESYEMSPDFTFLVADDLEESREFVDKLKDLNIKSGLIARIDALSEFLPDTVTQRENINKLKIFKNKISEIDLSNLSLKRDLIISELQRLHDNIVEIGELSIASEGEGNSIIKKCDEITGLHDSLSIILNLKTVLSQENVKDMALQKCQNITAKNMKILLLEKCVDIVVTLNTIPKDIKNRYVSSQGEDFLITVYSKGQIFDERVLNQFSGELRKVSPTATGGPILLMKFLRLLIDKGATATIFAIIAIFILLLIDFRSLSDTIIAIVPLLIGVSWLFGVISILGIKLNVNSLSIFPLILGIGIDDGVHILHRYKREGIGSIALVLKCTGRSVLLTSLTTAIAFGSMAFSVRRGIASGGLILAVGVMLCFLTSVLVLPAIITLYENFKKR